MHRQAVLAPVRTWPFAGIFLPAMRVAHTWLKGSMRATHSGGLGGKVGGRGPQPRLDPFGYPRLAKHDMLNTIC